MSSCSQSCTKLCWEMSQVHESAGYFQTNCVVMDASKHR